MIEKSLILFAECRKFLSVSFSKEASGFRISAYLVLTCESPKLFPFAYPRFSPVNIH